MAHGMIRSGVGLCLATGLATRGVRKKSLSQTGALAAWVVGWATFSAGYRFGFLLIGFYLSGSKLTRFGQATKRQLDENYKPGGQRDAFQVLACSVLATLIAVMHWVQFGHENLRLDSQFSRVNTFWLASYIGHYACCAADTWASEIGVLSTHQPVLITNLLQRVPAGTNGGISELGTMASVAGGMFIGVLYWLSTWLLYGWTQTQTMVIVFASLMGLFGSLVDSLLGATVQATFLNDKTHRIASESTPYASNSSNASSDRIVWVCGRDYLTNEQVNAVSVVVTSLASGLLALWLF